MKNLILLLLFPAAALAQFPLIYNTNNLFLSPSNTLSSNILASANVGYTKGANGQLTLSLSNSVSVTNLNVGNVLVTNNFGYVTSTQFAATNSTANTNITINADVNEVHLFLTNNASFTNFSGLAAGVSKDTVVYVYPQLVNRAIVWPSPGVAGYGVQWRTNDNAQVWTTFTNGVAYAVALHFNYTNIFGAISAWK